MINFTFSLCWIHLAIQIWKVKKILAAVESWDWCDLADSAKLHQDLHADSNKSHQVLHGESVCKSAIKTWSYMQSPPGQTRNSRWTNKRPGAQLQSPAVSQGLTSKFCHADCGVCHHGRGDILKAYPTMLQKQDSRISLQEILYRKLKKIWRMLIYDKTVKVNMTPITKSSSYCGPWTHSVQ